MTIIKVIALQSYNIAAPQSEKIKMLIMHIRNACKMNYRVSLSFSNRDDSPSSCNTTIILDKTQNITGNIKDKTSFKSRALKTDIDLNCTLRFDTKPVLKSKFKCVDIPNTTKAVKGYNISPFPSKDLSEKSQPAFRFGSKSPIELNKTLNFTDFFGRTPSTSASADKKNDSKKCNKRSYSSTPDDKNISHSKTSVTTSKLKIQSLLQKFGQKHRDIMNGIKPKSNRQKQGVYIRNLRDSLFSQIFVKTMIFRAWKSLLSN